jgi:SET domain-containing protein
MIYKAIKDIKKGEEITVNYNWNPNSKKPVDEFLVDFNEHQK